MRRLLGAHKHVLVVVSGAHLLSLLNCGAELKMVTSPLPVHLDISCYHLFASTADDDDELMEEELEMVAPWPTTRLFASLVIFQLLFEVQTTMMSS